MAIQVTHFIVKTIEGEGATRDDAERAARTQVPAEAFDLCTEIIQQGQEGVLEFRAATEADARAQWIEQAPANVRLTNFECVAQPPKGVVGIGKKPGCWKAGWLKPFQVHLTFKLKQVTLTLDSAPMTPSDANTLVALLEDWSVRQSVADQLAAIGAPVVEPLLPALSHRNWIVRSTAADILGRIGDPRGVDLLVGVLADENCEAQVSAAAALGAIGDRKALRPLVAALHSAKDARVREHIQQALNKLGATPGDIIDLPTEQRKKIYADLMETLDRELLLGTSLAQDVQRAAYGWPGPLGFDEPATSYRKINRILQEKSAQARAATLAKMLEKYGLKEFELLLIEKEGKEKKWAV